VRRITADGDGEEAEEQQHRYEYLVSERGTSALYTIFRVFPVLFGSRT